MKLLANLLIVALSLVLSLSFYAVSYAKNKKHHIHHVVKKEPKSEYAPPSKISSPASLSVIINSAINSVDSNLNIGVAVKSMKYGDTLYRHNDNRTFVPASILKILTAEAALVFLGPEYKFQTVVYTDASALTNGVLYGNLYLVHSGDPTLTYYDLIDLIDSLKAQNIYQVQGSIYIDTTAYDQAVYGPGWIWKDTRYCYGAPIAASIINHNCLSFSVAPEKSLGLTMNSSASHKHFISSNRKSVVKSALPRTTTTAGISSGIVSNILEYNKSLVRTLFARSGIQIIGNVSTGVAPQNLPVIATHQSKPLSSLITEMLKKSDNIIAGSIFKKLGELYSKQPGSWENGSKAVSQILAHRAKVNTANMQVLDGSGLSRYNEITPSQMLQVLDFAYHDNATNYEFISGLPVAGVDGTLKHRLQNIAWRVRAKTGTMSGVNSLAGYAITQDKEALAFVIIVNGKLGMGWRYKELEDRIVTALTRYSRT